MTTIRTIIRNRKIEVPAPSELPDGAEVDVTVERSEIGDDVPTSPEEITRILAAMEMLEPLDIPEGVARELEYWENSLNQRSLHHEATPEDAFQ
ncbi:MAG: hypothetical protein K2X38_10615 [Gemmataceae bacterium]|nr:hypothetical protein [Gemmataceae bacterium]